MKTTIYTNPYWNSAHAIQREFDEIATQKWREETQTQPPLGLLISGVNIQHAHQNTEGTTPCA